MRIATLLRPEGPVAAVVRGDLVLPLTGPGPASVRALAAGGPAVLAGVAARADAAPRDAWLPLGSVALGPAVPDPGAIYTIGHNYRAPGEPPGSGPERPLVYGKAASSVGAPGAVLAWDRALTDNVDAECELAVVIGAPAVRVAEADAMAHVFGYTIIDDVSSRDPWLDGDQWLLGKSMPGFCPVGPWVVTADAFDPSDVRLGCTIDGAPIQDDRTSAMRFGVAAIVSYLSRHAELRPGDLIATGTPARLATPPGRARRLRPGDTVSAWIDGIGELVTRIG